MNKVLRILFLVAYVPVFILGFVVIHEVGHTVMARLLGDPNSTFYLVRITEESTCLGCNIYDATRLTAGANLVVALSGLLATQLVALLLLAAAGWAAGRPFLSRLLAGSALAMMVLDVLVQGIQGLLYNIAHHTWPTNVDLMDVMLLVQRWTGASQVVMKVVLAAVLVVWVVLFVWLFRRITRRRRQAMARALLPA